MRDTVIKWHLSPTQDRFVASPAVIPVLVGPQGEGKTFAGAVAMFNYAQKWHRLTRETLRGAVIRDTFENIKRMTRPSINQCLGLLTTWSDGGKRLRGLDGCMEIDLFGMDSPAALTKIQGAEYSFIWIEEPAPMLERANAGIAEEVYDACLSRVARQISSVHQEIGLRPRLQVTMNPADEAHWTYREFVESPRFRAWSGFNPGAPDITLELFTMAYGENTHLSNIARQTAKAAFEKDQGLYSRYVEGRWAYVQAGVRVVPEYNPELHLAKEKLDPLPGVEAMRCWDGGLNPTCVILQATPQGRVFVLDSWVGQNIGMRQLIKLYVAQTVATRYRRVNKWRDVGDPSLTAREQSSSDVSGAGVIESELQTMFEPGPVGWGPRREALKEVCSRLVDGVPMLQVSPHERHVHHALRGGWHYAKASSGRVLSDRPVKDIHSHPGDALAYGLAMLLGRETSIRARRDFDRSLKMVARGIV